MISEIDPLLVVVAAFIVGFGLVSLIWRFLPGAKKEEEEKRGADRLADFSRVAGEFETWSSSPGRSEEEYADILGLDGRVTPSILNERLRELAARHPVGSEERRLIEEASAHFRRRLGVG